jgi:hypothetical protein
VQVLKKSEATKQFSLRKKKREEEREGAGIRKILGGTTAPAGLFHLDPLPMLTAANMFPQIPTLQAGAARPQSDWIGTCLSPFCGRRAGWRADRATWFLK